MSKRCTIFVITFFILFMTKGMTAQAVTVALNNGEINFDVPPVKLEGNVLIPLRAIIESMGGQVVWHGKGRITASIRDNSVKFIVGEKNVIKNGFHLTLPHPPSLVKGRVLVPPELFAQAFNADVIYNNLNKVLIRYSSENTSKAKAQVLDYLGLLGRAFTENLSEQQWKTVLSKSGLKNIRGPQLKEYLKGCTISYPQILSWKYSTSDSGHRTSLITAGYQINFPDDPTNPGLNIWHKEVFAVILEQGKWVIDSVREERRHLSWLPRYALSRDKSEELERHWQRSNHYSKEEIYELNRTLTDPALRLVYASHNWDGPVENMPPEQQKEYFKMQRLFLPNVINSHGWNAFIAMTARYDLFFQVLQAVSNKDTIQLSLVADLFAQGHFIPAFIDVELKIKNNTWRISKISNVSSYNSVYQLKIENPERFEMLTTMYNFWRVRKHWFGVDESFVTL